jgi:hypothetical protein
MVYLGFLPMGTGSMSLTQRIVGGGFPSAEQTSIAECPISTTFVVGPCVICGNPGGNFLSPAKKK